jgi:DNA-binding LacI/PurR family transcriptional regulator
MGRLAMQMLLDLLQGKTVTNILVPGELIVRGSVSPPTDFAFQSQSLPEAA